MLSSAALLASAAIIGAMLFQWYWAPSYALTNKEVAAQLTDQKALLLPWQLSQLAQSGESKNYTLVVLSESQTTELELFKGYRNISFDQILNKENLKFFKKNQPVLISGTSESYALMAVHLIRAQGISKVFAAANEAEMNVKHGFSSFKPTQADKHSEKASFDYGRFFKRQGPSGVQPATTHEIPQGGVTVVKTQGGCS